MNRYRHLVLFWLKDASPAGIAEARAQLLSLQGRIPGLLALEAEPDIERSPRSCDLCLNTLFDSKASLDVYRTHPAHLPVIAYMKAHAEKSCTADYPVE